MTTQIGEEIADVVELPAEFDGLNVAVVGGFVRDRLRNVETNDIDLMVTEVVPAELKSRDFRPIEGASFPVFQDTLGREVALARTEESTGDGHTAFEAHAIPADIPHEEAIGRDLERRDLTINAVAVDARTGEIFDPHGGVEDLEAGILRHVSVAFAEDPLRVVRAARFRARTGFEIADETRELMAEVAPDLATIPDDRFGDELVKVLKQAVQPRAFVDVLDDVGALEIAFPEIAALAGVPAGPEGTHEEGDSLEHTLRVLEEMHDRQGNDVPALLAALGHDLGKGETSADELPAHHGHDKRGVPVARSMRSRLGLNRDLRGVMDTAASVHMRLPRVEKMTATAILDLAMDIHVSPLTLEQALDLGEADAKGRQPAGDFQNGPIREQLTVAIEAVETIGGSEAMEKRGIDPTDVGSEIPGERIGNLVRQDRVEAFRDRAGALVEAPGGNQ
ncbi:Multifunctional CCA protein [Halorhabdus tiamatea SARL4B]|uniref:Multifunctional CCA protein n=1 Tax=Halorhabdus tiamatea SARL4B TaxID=1033806 RepID=U2DY58_9EURY|nr:multifunctional tRNA nucleotidyltransferase/2'-nucleotidase/2',3'-cyclic phosphodiesterase [Halorhabdus tiamatea]ERJ05108.1 Multifunctional CCA protein [Halorhabdus tiamatea SARL4B]